LTWLSNVVQFVKLMSGSRPRRPGELHPDAELSAAPPADTRRVPPPPPLTGRRREDCACTFYLVFKEPASASHQTRQLIRRLGNLTNITEPQSPCQSLFSMRPNGIATEAGPTEKDELWGPAAHKKFAPTTRSKLSGHQARARRFNNYTVRRRACQQGHNARFFASCAPVELEPEPVKLSDPRKPRNLTQPLS
jgi:hypothetical protein